MNDRVEVRMRELLESGNRWRPSYCSGTESGAGFTVYKIYMSDGRDLLSVNK